MNPNHSLALRTMLPGLMLVVGAVAGIAATSSVTATLTGDRTSAHCAPLPEVIAAPKHGGAYIP